MAGAGAGRAGGGGGWTDGRQNFCSENIKMERTSVTKTRVEKNEGG